MRNRRFWASFFLIASILTAMMIFGFSSQDGPASQSFSEEIAEVVAPIIQPEYPALSMAARRSFLELLTMVLRKCAHFSEFALLGFNLTAYLGLRLRPWSMRANRRLAWGIATLFAATDELHQIFVSQRSAAVLDVLIDSAGSLTGVLVASLGLALVFRRRTNR